MKKTSADNKKAVKKTVAKADVVSFRDQTSACLLRRLSRIEGQFRGIRKMVEEDRDCLDVIQQVTAVREAITMLGIELLKDDFTCRRGTGDADEKFLKTLFKMR